MSDTPPSREFEPKLVTVLREGYSLRQLQQDALAGVVVGIVALPLAIAFAIASGVRPEQGLATAIVAGVLVSALGGTRVQIAGPTGAFVVIVYGVVQRFGYDGLALATFMAGILLVVMGVARFGAVIRFIPYPVTVGFTSGIALIIAAGQFHDALGLTVGPPPVQFLPRLASIARGAGTVNVWALGLCAGTILLIRLWPRVSTRVPGPLVALVASTALVRWLAIPVETIGSRFGEISTRLPAPHLPDVSWESLSALGSSAIAIALLGGIESLLSAVVADGMTGRQHRSNVELVAQGIANMASPIFGGIPATGAIARTATNVRNGGRTPIAGIVHSVTLLVLLIFAAPWAGLIPLATLAGILLVVAYTMSEWHLFVGLLRGPRSDVAVLLTTFLLTVLVDLAVAIQAGVVMAALLLMRRLAEVTQVRSLTEQLRRDETMPDEAEGPHVDLPAGVEVFEINGAFVFGATQKFSQTIATMKRKPRVMILRMQNVLTIDATGLRGLEEVQVRLDRQGTTLLLTSVRPEALEAIERSGLLKKIGPHHVVPSYAEAVALARSLIAGDAARAADHEGAP
ncbi:MAG: SulP family inorganic anion transporter [Candidatus Polarisedimenticolia bacterium]